jgi:hypothetical protein
MRNFTAPLPPALRKVSLLTFSFFLLKGLVWLGIAWFAWSK